MQYRQQWRHEYAENRVDLRRRFGAHRAVTGLEPDQQFDRLDLAERAARQDAAIIADQIAHCMDQPRLAIEPACATVGEQQPGGGDRGPAGDFGQLVLGAGDIAVEPAGGGFKRVQRAAAEFAVLTRQDQRGVDQPAEQAMRDIADIPGRRPVGARIGGQPAAEDAFGNTGALHARGAGFEIG